MYCQTDAQGKLDVSNSVITSSKICAFWGTPIMWRIFIIYSLVKILAQEKIIFVFFSLIIPRKYYFHQNNCQMTWKFIRGFQDICFLKFRGKIVWRPSIWIKIRSNGSFENPQWFFPDPSPKNVSFIGS